MATVQGLKNKLRSARSTQKLTKAMKTVATVKYSRISTVYSGYAQFEKQCRILYQANASEYVWCFKPKNEAAPVCYIVMTSNKGMCGSFNNDVFSFLEHFLSKENRTYSLMVCGKKAQMRFTEKGIPFENSFVLGDIPTFKDAELIFAAIESAFKKGEISGVKLVYPKYINMMRQMPVCKDIFEFDSGGEAQVSQPLFVPDKPSVVENTAKKLIVSRIYKCLLETALGAQAATLMTMRSAYDTSTEHCAQLETELNRKRQSQVTADVIETAAEYVENGDEDI